MSQRLVLGFILCIAILLITLIIPFDIRKLHVPVIAVLHGMCFGGGEYYFLLIEYSSVFM